MADVPFKLPFFITMFFSVGFDWSKIVLDLDEWMPTIIKACIYQFT